MHPSVHNMVKADLTNGEVIVILFDDDPLSVSAAISMVGEWAACGRMSERDAADVAVAIQETSEGRDDGI